MAAFELLQGDVIADARKRIGIRGLVLHGTEDSGHDLVIAKTSAVDDRALDDMLELSDIARPQVTGEQLHDIVAGGRDRVATVTLSEVVDQKRDV